MFEITKIVIESDSLTAGIILFDNAGNIWDYSAFYRCIIDTVKTYQAEENAPSVTSAFSNRDLTWSQIRAIPRRSTPGDAT